ncbi:MAG: TIGR04211 family SH3 domain-containing protein [Desulfosarcinaceae bacterium]|nr:TIGR04211 family SH3 domain-containing protein [Desulfosarcinaceae bacterium]
MFQPIKLMITVVLTLIIGTVTAAASTVYVTEDFEITMRTGPGVDRKIIALIRSGQRVEEISKSEEWTEIRLPSDKTGWVLSRYLSPKEPCALVKERLQTEFNQLQAEKAELETKNSDLEAENQRLEAQLASTQASLERVTGDFDSLKVESTDFLKLKTQFKKVTDELEETKTKADKFEDETGRLLRNQNIKWFLAGAGVLLIGFIIGFSSRRQKRRSSLL